MRFIPVLLLIVLIVIGVWLEMCLLYPQPAGDVTSAPPAAPALPKTVSENEKREARNQARMLTLNSKKEASRENGNISPIQFPSLEQVIRDQVESRALPPSLGASLLSENANRDASIRDRKSVV